MGVDFFSNIFKALIGMIICFFLLQPVNMVDYIVGFLNVEQDIYP